MVTAIGLISGGLDSILAARTLQEQDIRVVGISFTTPFFGSARAEAAAQMLNIELHVLDITDIHLEMVLAPKHGYGKGMNPCIDCHTMMFHEAGRLMEKMKADFLFSGEVLGERPMSQNHRSLRIVAEESGYADVIIRPLSAKLLPITQPEKEGKVDREKLLDISGRSRKRQIELAARYGIADYVQPAGGCLLTDPEYSRRLRELLQHCPKPDPRDVRMLKGFRHFRLKTGEKVIVGRNKEENERILAIKGDSDIILSVTDYPSPIVMLGAGATDAAIAAGASICVRYSDAPKDIKVAVSCSCKEKLAVIFAKACSDDELADIRI